MPKVVDRDKMRTSIVLAFQNCSEKKQITKISMRDIAEAAGISHSTLFHYFPSKDDIIIAYVKYVAKAYLDATKEITSKFDNSSANSIKRIVLEFIDFFYIQEPQYSNIFIQIYAIGIHSPAVQEVIRQQYNEWIETFSHTLEKITKKNMTKESKALMVLFEGLFLFGLNYDNSKSTAIEIMELMNIM